MLSMGVRALLTRTRRLATDVVLSTAAFSTVTVLPLLQSGNGATHDQLGSLLFHVGLYAAVSCVVLSVTRTYRMIWRYMSFQDLLTLIGATALTVVGFLALEMLFMSPNLTVPTALLIWTIALIWIANIGFLATPRFVARLLCESRAFTRQHRVDQDSGPIRVLLTGDVARMDTFIRQCERDLSSRYQVVGVLTDDVQLHGSYLHGVQVLGSVDNLIPALTRLGAHGRRPRTLVLAKDDASRADFARLLELTAAANIKIGRLPPHGLVADSTPVQPLELRDLLGRPEIRIDMKAVAAMIQGKCVMVTGGGGSIGSELSRQIAGLKPAKLIVLDASEFNLYSIDQELREKYPEIVRETALVDIRDAALVSHWIGVSRPDIVFHAAALKHVPLIESHPIEGIKTNVFGTINVADACRAHGVAAMVTISTDKAVNPTNVMGATKRLAEAYCQGVDQVGAAGVTRFITVRFGNVLGSAGSVVPLFQHQIETGGPVTVTHPEINRYFMTIPEAVTLVLQAGAQGFTVEEERGNIYLLDMGEPVKIIDLARQMIRLFGRRPDVDIKISIIGLRPGEKLYEETIHNDESILPTRSKAILKLAPRTTDLRIIRQQVQELRHACTNNDRERALRVLKISVPDYVSAEQCASVSSSATHSD